MIQQPDLQSSWTKVTNGIGDTEFLCTAGQILLAFTQHEGQDIN